MELLSSSSTVVKSGILIEFSCKIGIEGIDLRIFDFTLNEIASSFSDSSFGEGKIGEDRFE